MCAFGMRHDRELGGIRGTMASSGSSASSASSANQHRAALEALFAPKTPAPPPVVSKRDSAKMITAPSRVSTTDVVRAAEQERLVARLLAAQGRTEISRAAEDVARAGFAFPDEQEVHLQLLEHGDEDRVRSALSVFARLLDSEPAKRRTVLDSRLRRIEDCADEASTRELGSVVRRKLARSARPL